MAFRESSGDDGFWLGIARAFLDNLPEQTEQEVLSLSQLRPLSKAGPVPEGCVRVTGYCENGSWFLGVDCLMTQDTHFADIRLPSTEKPDPYAELKKAHAEGKVVQFKPHGCPWEDSEKPDFTAPIACYRIKPEPETFEAHGKTWTRHTPGDPMPCDGEAMVDTLWRVELPPNSLLSIHEADPAKDWDWSAKCQNEHQIIGWRYADEPQPEQSANAKAHAEFQDELEVVWNGEPALANANPAKDMALGGTMYWRDLARQLAEVWWKCHSIGASLQHGDIDTDVSFTVCCEQHGGQCFHADTPHNAWLKAEKWLMSPDRANFPIACLEPATK